MSRAYLQMPTRRVAPFNSSFPSGSLGFVWDPTNRTVAIPLKRRTKYLARLEPWIPGASISLRDCQRMIGCLQHCTLALPDARSYLPSLFHFCSSFKNSDNPSTLHRIPAACLDDISWWRSHLSSDWCGSSVSSPPDPIPNAIFVDASSFGIGFTFDSRWLAWRLLEGWHSEERDIGWAEMVAIDLGLRTLIHAGFRDCHFTLHSDNQGVAGALKSGRSHNAAQNLILRYIVSNSRDYNIWLSLPWVKSQDNVSDQISRGRFPLSPPFERAPPLPQYLKPFVALV